MRIFKYWTRIEGSLDVEGTSQTVHCFGGSNESTMAATADARRRLERAARRLAGTLPRDDSYELDIREEVLASVDARNVVTRNRYGAEVLNSEDLMFVDIDEPRLGFWDTFRRARPLAQRKERIVEQVRQLAAKATELRGLGIRLYETHNGIRAIVTGRHFDPKSAATQKLLKRFHADWLYSSMCQRQACFRARLTPKPFRMKCRTHKVVFPRGEEAQVAAHRAWGSEYQHHRRGYCTCRYLCSIGHDVRDRVVSFHDAQTGAFSGLRLA